MALGKAVQLSLSSNQYVRFPDNDAFDFTGDGCIELWFGGTEANTSALVSHHPGDSGFPTGFSFLYHNGNQQMWFHMGNASDQWKSWSFAGTQLFDGNMHHLAVDWIFGTQAEFFFDGTSQGTVATNTPNFSSTSLLSIGCRLHSDGTTVYNPLSGTVDEVRLSDIRRHTGNFTPGTTPFVSDGNTVGLWHLDEGSGTLTDDSSPTSVQGTLINSPSWVDGYISLPSVGGVSSQRDGFVSTMGW